MTMSIANLNTELLRTAERLANDYPGLAAGTVLRCYGRSVRRLRVSGTEWRRLPVEAETMTRRRLDLRCSSRHHEVRRG